MQTGNVTDLALLGDGFFVVRTPDGVAYTRQGNFKVTQAGVLVTSDGYPVLSMAGDRPEGGQPVTINTDLGGATKFVVDANGNLTFNGETFAQLAIYDFPKPYQLKKLGSALFIPANEEAAARPAPPTTTVAQGSIEKSNVDTVSEMVNMVETSRFFETCQRVIRGFDDMASKAVNELARV